MQTNKTPKVTLVGAGPGDPDLLTIKGAKALASADVVLYDALVNHRLFEHVPGKAKTVFVGKRKGFKAFPQDEINELIVSHAFSYGHVVRLKGGDPFVFARGTEEIEYIESFGIPCEVVPGISSALAVPASQGVSLTRRGTAQSFWVITGTTSQQKLSKDLYHASRSTATVVILMGMSKLDEIVQLFRNEGKGTMPVAVIQNGTTKNENVGVGTIDTITYVVKEKQLSSPAVIVIGEVVRESHKLKQYYRQAMAISG